MQDRIIAARRPSDSTRFDFASRFCSIARRVDASIKMNARAIPARVPAAHHENASANPARREQ
jgi:hypothetical protein